MMRINLVTEKIVEVLESYCNDKGYQVESKKNLDRDWRLDISNIKEMTLVTVYHTGTIVMGGKKNDLKVEFDELIQELSTNNPQKFVSGEVKKISACATKYVIVAYDIRKKIKENLGTLKATIEITDNPRTETEYRAKVTRNSSSLTITQFNNSTLLLQGKEDTLFHNACDFIEEIANPAESEVIARFISSDEKTLEYFSSKCTPKLIELAEKNAKKKLENVYEYVEIHDQKWFVASECLCLSEIPLPEFSPLVMPASKAFEGFAKKLLVDIGLYEPSDFQNKSINFSRLNDTNDPNRKGICNKDRHANSMLKLLSVCIDTNRNFVMHSDDSKITKVNSIEEGIEKVDTIFKDAKKVFGYFHDLYKLL